ncbi:permease-like cell division protein FtsX [Planotetraspora kaengkrachanensis]|uniref:FtsX extracellular domain-containing protein n=1 Tax=Planotetraspora kaengkrachanensis TaxID=575193 RepID=A0A8J3VCS6_9ACTN|nr:permease-like cell division protein FtsX [Planotetraspora kaengkrachanensis]GIG85032.1 hypothetical protein Pka01_81590 [Planotetraspora kaengkrachanensis]
MIDQRLREALSEAAETARLHSIRPLRVPSKRRRPRVALLAAVPAALAIGILAFVRLTPPPMEAATGGPPPRLSAFLCLKDDVFPRCKGHGEATTDDRRRIEQVLKSLPQVASFEFESQDEAYRNFLSNIVASADTRQRKWLTSVRSGDVPASFRVTVKSPDGLAAVTRAVEALPGVSNVVPGP